MAWRGLEVLPQVCMLIRATLCPCEASVSRRHPYNKGALLGIVATQEQKEGFVGQERGSVSFLAVFLGPPAKFSIVK